MSIRLGDVSRVMVTYITYTFWDLLADMGGYLGILLGSSLLSMFGTLQESVLRVHKLCSSLARRN